MIKLPFKISFEQAVYGSFPFWRRGYAILTRSPGCRPEWIAALKLAAQRFGEPPVGATAAESFFALRLESGPWMVVGVAPQGYDDEGRPGALAFHAIFIGAWAYQWLGANPFRFAGLLRRTWYAADQDQILPAGVCDGSEVDEMATPLAAPNADARLSPIVAALANGGRVVVQSHEPIDELARNVWHTLPRAVRRRATVATWAFDNLNQFDLVAMPKLSGTSLTGSELIVRLECAMR